MKYILIILLTLSFVLSNTASTNSKIKKTNNKLVVIKKQYKNTYRHFKNTANRIITEERTITSLGKKIANLKASLRNTKKGAVKKRIRLGKYEQNYKTIVSKKKRARRETNKLHSRTPLVFYRSLK